MLDLTAFIVRVKIESQESSTEEANGDLCEVNFEDVYDCQQGPDKGKEGQSPPKGLFTGWRVALLIYFTLKFPILLTRLIEVDPPSQTHQQPARQVLHYPEINGCGDHHYHQHIEGVVGDEGEDEIDSDDGDFENDVNCCSSGA